MSPITMAATGDSLITRRLLRESESFQELAGLLKSTDVRFTNLETVVRRDEGFPSAQSGGTWTSAIPEVLEDLQAYGFNLVNWATNHTLDYSYGGLESTRRYLDHYRFVHGGAGLNLAEASLPKYLDTAAGRVAFIAVTASFHESWIAGEQRSDVAGRPGINPLRHETRYRLKRERLAALRETAAACGINAAREQSIRNGFQQPDSADLLRFGSHLFVEAAAGEAEGETSYPDKNDMERVLKSIREARRQAGHVVISFHAHAFRDGRNQMAAEFLELFSRSCIDGGADVVIGHGPHIVRGIEIYKGRPIFYSLGNFIFQSDTVTNLPSDYYTKYGLGPEHTTADAFDVRSDSDKRGYAVNPAIWRSIMPLWRMEAGELKELTLYPLELGFGLPRHVRGWPALASDTAVLEEVIALSHEYGTTGFEIKGQKAVWRKK